MNPQDCASTLYLPSLEGSVHPHGTVAPDLPWSGSPEHRMLLAEAHLQLCSPRHRSRFGQEITSNTASMCVIPFRFSPERVSACASDAESERSTCLRPARQVLLNMESRLQTAAISTDIDDERKAFERRCTGNVAGERGPWCVRRRGVTGRSSSCESL
jgi:hypothetical protein